MGKLNGGEFLLDLTPITIEESVDSETYTNITNAKVLNQLTNLKRYIPNEKAIKPVWVKFVNDETDEIVVVKGELAKTSGDEEFEIHVKTKGYELTIHIEFTQAVNDNNDPIDDWYIDTNDAKYLFLSNASIINTLIKNNDIDNTKPLYWHNVYVDRTGGSGVVKIKGTLSIINNSQDAITREGLQALLQTEGFCALFVGGRNTLVDSSEVYDCTPLYIVYSSENFYSLYYVKDDGTIGFVSLGNTLPSGQYTITDLGTNKIN